MIHTFNPNKVIIHGTFIDHETFFIWAEQKKQKKYQEYANFMYPFLFSPFELRLLLFRFHELSFYGTFIEIEKFLIKVPLIERQFYSEAGNIPVYQANSSDEHYLFPLEGIIIPTKDIADYIQTMKTWIDIDEWILSDDLQFWLSLFSQIEVDISNGLFLPSTSGQWKLTDMNWNDWKESIPSSCLSIRRQSAQLLHQSSSDYITEDDIEMIGYRVGDLLIRSLITSNQEGKKVIDDIKKGKPQVLNMILSSLEGALPTKNGETLIEESYFLEELGVIPKTPFKTGLEVKEPLSASEPWKLKLFVQDRQNESLIVTMKELQQGTHPWTSNPIPKIKRDLYAGSKKSSLIADLSPMKDETELSPEEVYQFLIEDSQHLQQAGFTIFVPTWMKTWRNDYSVKVSLDQPSFITSTSVDPMMNWASLTSFEYEVSVAGETLTEEEFSKLVKSKEALVQVRGKWLMWDPIQASKLKQQLDRKKDKKLSFFDAWQAHLSKNTTTETAFDEKNDEPEIEWQIDWDEQMEEMLKSVTSKEVDLYDTPRTLKGTLRTYQQQGYSWLVEMRKIGFGACLADDMGLGKSIQTIAYMLKIIEEQRQNKQNLVPFLLICPTSLIGNWVYELNQFAPTIKVFVHHGDNRIFDTDINQVIKQYDIIITSYSLAVRDETIWTNSNWNGLILDEAQQLKNIQTKQRRSIKKITSLHRIALTGTPIENRLTELWSMIDLLNPGYLGSFRHFQQTFIREIEGQQKNETRLLQLQQLVSPFLLRRKKSDPTLELQLPDKHEQTHLVGLTMEQASLYQVVVNELLEHVNNVTEMERRALILSSLTKLKQICNHPSLFLKDGEPLENRSEKWELLITLLEQIVDNEEKTLIFSQYKEMGELLQRGISELLGLDALFLHGSLPRTKREELIETFKTDKDKKIFILSLKAGGVGLNLTAANHVIHYDRWWNPAVENQATDRAYRIGQKQHVTVHKMVTKGTLEERIDQMLKQKQLLADQVLASGEGQLSELTNDELRELLELRG